MSMSSMSHTSHMSRMRIDLRPELAALKRAVEQHPALQWDNRLTTLAGQEARCPLVSLLLCLLSTCPGEPDQSTAFKSVQASGTL